MAIQLHEVGVEVFGTAIVERAAFRDLFDYAFLYSTSVSADFNVKNYYILEDSQRKDDKIILDLLLYAQYDAFVALQLNNEDRDIDPTFCPPSVTRLVR